jgi:hypothetical protein
MVVQSLVFILTRTIQTPSTPRDMGFLRLPLLRLVHLQAVQRTCTHPVSNRTHQS